MLLRTQTVAYVVLAPKKVPGKYAKPAKILCVICETCLAIVLTTADLRLINFPKIVSSISPGKLDV